MLLTKYVGEKISKIPLKQISLPYVLPSIYMLLHTVELLLVRFLFLLYKGVYKL